MRFVLEDYEVGVCACVRVCVCVCMYVLIYDYIYVLFVCRVYTYTHWHRGINPFWPHKFCFKLLLGLEPMAPIRPQLLVSHANLRDMCICKHACMYDHVCTYMHTYMYGQSKMPVTNVFPEQDAIHLFQFL